LHSARLKAHSTVRKMKFCLVVLGICLAATHVLSAPQGDVVAWGLNQPSPPQGASNNIIQIASGQFHHLALRADGTMISWSSSSGFPFSLPDGLTNVVNIAAGANHSLAVRSNGTVVAWGDNSSLQTNVPPGITTAVAVAGGDFHSLVLLSNGLVGGWGANNAGQAAPPIGLNGVVAIAAGGNFSMALRVVGNRGRIVAWGDNRSGQASPQLALRDGTINVVAIAAGSNHGLALDASGNVYGWGRNTSGQASPPGLNNVVAIAAGGDDSLALRANGTVVPWGATSSGSGAPPSTLTNVVAIAVGDRVDVLNHKLAIVFRPLLVTTPPTNMTVLLGQTATFTVVADGSNPLSYRWQKDGMNIPLATSASYNVVNAQRNDAGVYNVIITAANGATTNASATLTVNSPPSIVAEPSDVTTNAGQSARFEVSAIGTSPLHYQWRHGNVPISSANLSNYTVFNVQQADAGAYSVVITNQFGSVTSRMAQLTVTFPPVITQQPQSQTVVVGHGVTFSVEANNATHYHWRKDNANIPNETNSQYTISNVQLSNSGTYSVQVSNMFGSVLSANATLIVQAAPVGPTNVITWGQRYVFNGSDFVDTITPAGLSNAVRLAAGKLHSLALKDDNTVLGWGDNSRGQSAAPVDLQNVTAIAAGNYHSLALTAAGTVAAWGADDFGQSTPPAGLNDVAVIAAGGNHCVVLRTGGGFVGWGANQFGQRSLPPGLPVLTNLAAGADFTLGLSAQGTVVGWGNNEFGQTRPPTSLSNVIAIAAGLSHSLALRKDGTVVAWGHNDHGQTNVPPDLTDVIAISAGENHCLALLNSGHVVAWGQNNEGQTDVPAQLTASSIAAGGTRSLAVIRRLYVLQPPFRVPEGWRIYIRTSDNSPITESQLTRIDMRATANPGLPLQNWSSLPPNFVLENGQVRFDDSATSLTRRFYTAIEHQ
jgi:alpha-tubulin suppressor-like RCC1 family protein